MLTRITIRDLAIVAHLDLDLAAGFSSLTGETGAGKSILLNALGLALGEKADAGYIRTGASKAEVCIEFDLTSVPAARHWLDERDLLDPEHATSCIIRRVVMAEGRSRAYINSTVVTLPLLQGLGQLLVQIHGQHAHLQLLQAQEQRRLLDENLGLASQLASLAHIWKDWQQAEQDFQALSQQQATAHARSQFLAYQIEELEAAEVREQSYEALAQEHLRLANASRILDTGRQQMNLLYDHDSHSINAMLNQSLAAIRDMADFDPHLGESATLLEECAIQLKEAYLRLRDGVEQIEPDPARLVWLDEKLAQQHHLARKHQCHPEMLAATLDQLQSEAGSLTAMDSQLEQLAQSRQELAAKYHHLAAVISDIRSQGASELAQKITTLIRELGMDQGQFAIQVSQAEPPQCTSHGWDQIEFQVTANKGVPARSLQRVASGGELSRISLAIQVAATDSMKVPTLIYDEVDTGIGGRVAAMVGQKLRTLGEKGYQILCITHLAQVASMAHQHYLVEKRHDGSLTESCVYLLDEHARIEETARMIGGVHITEQTLAHAREMLQIPLTTTS